MIFLPSTTHSLLHFTMISYSDLLCNPYNQTHLHLNFHSTTIATYTTQMLLILYRHLTVTLTSTPTSTFTSTPPPQPHMPHTCSHPVQTSYCHSVFTWLLILLPVKSLSVEFGCGITKATRSAQECHARAVPLFLAVLL